MRVLAAHPVIGRVAGFFERRQSFKQAQARWAHELEAFDRPLVKIKANPIIKTTL